MYIHIHDLHQQQAVKNIKQTNQIMEQSECNIQMDFCCSPAQTGATYIRTVPVVALLSLKLMRAHVPLLPTPSTFPYLSSRPYILLCQPWPATLILVWQQPPSKFSSGSAVKIPFQTPARSGPAVCSTVPKWSVFVGFSPVGPTCYFGFGMYGMYYLSLLLAGLKHDMRCV